MRVLIVDDEIDIRFIIGMTVQRLGHQTIEASNAESAFAICRDDPPDAMLLDVSMPGESGLEMLQRLQADGLVPGPIALLSAAFPGQLNQVADQHGILHLPKPFGIDDLEALISQIEALAAG